MFQRRVVSALVVLVIASVCVNCPLNAAQSTSPSERAESQYRKPYRFTTDWFTRHIPRWRSILERYAGKPNIRYLEVGVFEGRSFLWVLENVLTHPSSTATAIDVFPEDLEQRFTGNLDLSGARKRITILKGSSNRVLRKLRLSSFAIIYIDGSHLAKDVYRDATLSWDLLKPEGILIFDDYLWQLHYPSDLRPKISIDAFLKAFAGEMEVVLYDYQIAVRKKGTVCQKPDCSTIGPYGYDWYNRALYELSGYRPVNLSEDEKKTLESFLVLYVEAHHSQAEVARLINSRPEFLRLNNKLRLAPTK